MDEQILGPGDLMFFKMRSRRIDVAIVQKNEYNSSEESDDEIMNSLEENDDMTMNSADESHKLDGDGIILIAQRARLTTHEKNRLDQLLPAPDDGPFLGLATRLTSTNVGRHDMLRLPIRFHLHSCFPPPIFSLYLFYT